MRKLIAALGAAVILVVGVFVGTAYANTDVDLGSAVNVRSISADYVSSGPADTAYDANCPAGYKALGGGGLAYTTGPTAYYAIKATFPLDADTWRVIANTSSGVSVRVHVLCMVLS